MCIHRLIPSLNHLTVYVYWPKSLLKQGNNLLSLGGLSGTTPLCLVTWELLLIMQNALPSPHKPTSICIGENLNKQTLPTKRIFTSDWLSGSYIRWKPTFSIHRILIRPAHAPASVA